MSAFISYLHLAHGINNFFVLAPNLTIYNKLITDFSDRAHPKYVSLRLNAVPSMKISEPKYGRMSSSTPRVTVGGTFSSPSF